jgi:hypothetical protein
MAVEKKKSMDTGRGDNFLLAEAEPFSAIIQAQGFKIVS